MSISYVYKNPSLNGETCPVCGKKLWNIFRCGNCGKIFCENCRPDLIKKEDDVIDVTCKCGSTGLFYST